MIIAWVQFFRFFLKVIVFPLFAPAGFLSRNIEYIFLPLKVLHFSTFQGPFFCSKLASSIHRINQDTVENSLSLVVLTLRIARYTLVNTIRLLNNWDLLLCFVFVFVFIFFLTFIVSDRFWWSVANFSALGTGCQFTRAWHRLPVSPRLAPVASFPALGTVCCFPALEDSACSSFYVLHWNLSVVFLL